LPVGVGLAFSFALARSLLLSLEAKTQPTRALFVSAIANLKAASRLAVDDDMSQCGAPSSIWRT